METEHYHDRKQRIKLRIVTNIGLNLLCTSMKSWKVAEFLPHIQKAYDEVIEDQEGTKPVKVIRIKKDNFYIANSEIVGDVFDDNEELFCELMEKEGKAKKKMEKRKTKEVDEKQEQRQEKQVNEVNHKYAQKKNREKHGEIQKNHEENIQKQAKPEKYVKNVERQEQLKQQEKQEKKEKNLKKQENYAQRQKKHSQKPSNEALANQSEKHAQKQESDRSLIASKVATIKSILNQKIAKQESTGLSKKLEKLANKPHYMPNKLDISELARRIKGNSDSTQAVPNPVNTVKKIIKIREHSDESDE